MQISEYRNSLAISQSAVKDFRFKSPRRWKALWIDREPEDRDDDVFTFGNLVDTLLFTPELLNERFYIADVSKIPKGGVEKIVSRVYQEYLKLDVKDCPTPIKNIKIIDDSSLPETYEEITYNLEPLRAEILQACKDEAWQGTWKDDTRINKIIAQGTEYFGLLDLAKGRDVITTEVNFDAISVVNRLKTDSTVLKYFVQNEEFRNLYQVELFTTYVNDNLTELPVKGAIDIVHIDVKNNIVQLVDFKTTFSAFDFIKSIKQYSYCDQLSFYDYLLRQKFADLEFLKKNNLDGETLKFNNPINIAIDRDEKLPYIYEYNWNDIQISRDGNESFLFSLYDTNIHASKIRKGWKTLLDDISWHMETGLWDYSREYYKNGKIKVNLLNS